MRCFGIPSSICGRVLRSTFQKTHLLLWTSIFPGSSHWCHTRQFIMSRCWVLDKMPPTWSDGLVVRTRQHRAPPDLVTQMRSALKEFDCWAILDRTGEFVEYPAGGLISRFYDQL